jgi:hypothetical protein
MNCQKPTSRDGGIRRETARTPSESAPPGNSQGFVENFLHDLAAGSKLICNILDQTESLWVQDFRSGLRIVRMQSSRLEGVSQVPPPILALAKSMFHGIWSTWVAPIGCEQLRVNSLVAASYPEPINSREPLHDDHISNGYPWNVRK